MNNERFGVGDLQESVELIKSMRPDYWTVIVYRLPDFDHIFCTSVDSLEKYNKFIENNPGVEIINTCAIAKMPDNFIDRNYNQYAQDPFESLDSVPFLNRSTSAPNKLSILTGYGDFTFHELSHVSIGCDKKAFIADCPRWKKMIKKFVIWFQNMWDNRKWKPL